MGAYEIYFFRVGAHVRLRVSGQGAPKGCLRSSSRDLNLLTSWLGCPVGKGQFRAEMSLQDAPYAGSLSRSSLHTFSFLYGYGRLTRRAIV